jgi:hypothetical protein
MKQDILCTICKATAEVTFQHLFDYITVQLPCGHLVDLTLVREQNIAALHEYYQESTAY